MSKLRGAYISETKKSLQISARMFTDKHLWKGKKATQRMRDCLEGGVAQASVWKGVPSLLLHEGKSSEGALQAVRGARSLKPKDFVDKHGCRPWH